MELRLRTLLLISILAAATIAVAAIGLPRLGVDPLAFRTPATPTAPAVGTQTLAGQRITFADESATWDWQATCQDALATWVSSRPTPSARSG